MKFILSFLLSIVILLIILKQLKDKSEKFRGISASSGSSSGGSDSFWKDLQIGVMV